MTDIYSVSLLDLLPQSLKQDPEVCAIAQALDPEFQEISATIVQTMVLHNVDNLPEDVLGLLAWQFHVDFYDPGLDIDQKRALVKSAIRRHRMKGTPAAVEELMQQVFGDGTVEEWFEYDGQPYHFRVVTNNMAVTNEQAELFVRALKSVTRQTAVLDTIIITMGDQMNLYLGGVLHTGDYLTVKQVV